ncbi:TPA: trimethoprim-resistant dihydrofolate reductase DfrA23, partial [Salmonella enterica subsp. enterica serovar Typhimurium]|nr:trimethoprim-resistant dihydrofolate reductase DfrA23 [Salmonella enterica subsp. enterica serovar Typhimurium]HAG7063556.1 trimethoprim-resistant dihydrofolate reductase DfrA23 [Salmonella enterica subsp. enterica serovar Typhimurium]
FGRNGQIPWTCKEDMKRFTTISKEIRVCVMGKNTYKDMLDMQMKKEGAEERIKEKGILPERESYVVSSTLKPEDVIGATVVPDLRAVLNQYHDSDQRIAVIGGEKLYVQALASATKVHMTVMHKPYNCDRTLPMSYIDKKFVAGQGSITIQTAVDGETHPVKFITYERARP